MTRWMAYQAEKKKMGPTGKVPALCHAHRGEESRQSGREGHQDGVVIDAPWSIHAPKLIIW